MSADLLHGVDRFNLQNESRCEGVRCCGSADHLVRLEEEGRGNGEVQSLGRLEVDDRWILLMRIFVVYYRVVFM
jgi:hypothetical protein